MAGDDNEYYTLQVVVYACTIALCCIAVGARVWVKLRILKSFVLEDWLIVISLGLCTTALATYAKMVAIGFGKHQNDISDEDIVKIYKLFLAGEMIYVTCAVVLKLSITILLLRLSRLVRWVRHLVLATGVFYAGCGVTLLVMILCQCIPTQHFWDLAPYPSAPHPGCMPREKFRALVWVNAVISLVTDGIFAIVPIYLIWGLKMDLKTKIGIGTVLSLGLTTVGVNIARFNYIAPMGSWEDFTYNTVPLVITTILEIGIGIICASLASLRPLLRICVRKLNIILTSLSCITPGDLSTSQSSNTKGATLQPPVTYSLPTKPLFTHLPSDDSILQNIATATSQPYQNTLHSTTSDLSKSQGVNSSLCIEVEHLYSVEMHPVASALSPWKQPGQTLVQTVIADEEDVEEWRRIIKSSDSRSLELANEIREGVDQSVDVALPALLQ